MAPRARRISLLLTLAATLAASGALSASARAQDAAFDGCSVFAQAPNFSLGKMHYVASTTCKHNEFALTSYIGNEWFKPGADTDSWSNSATHVCNPGGPVRKCAVSTTGPYKGPGKYCTVAMTDLWFVNRIAQRSCAVYG